ncbi:MAG: hypothetical protein U0235_17940 [Polyangiaceae bacterium]
MIAGPLADAPAAIARLEAIADTSAVAPEARARGRRSGRARRPRGRGVRVGAPPGTTSNGSPVSARCWVSVAGLAELLVRAARFEREGPRDDAAAQRHLLAALRVGPSDAEAGALLREIGAAIVGPAAPAPPAAEIAEPPRPAHSASVRASVGERRSGLPRGARRRAHAQAQGDPTNDVVADELTRTPHQARSLARVFALIQRPRRRGDPRATPGAPLGSARSSASSPRTRGAAFNSDAEAQLFASFADGLPDD